MSHREAIDLKAPFSQKRTPVQHYAQMSPRTTAQQRPSSVLTHCYKCRNETGQCLLHLTDMRALRKVSVLREILVQLVGCC